MQLKRLTALIVLLSFITVNFSKVIIWAHYELYKTELTQKYCVNKDKPGMHCCAKCLLKKKLAEEDAKQNSPAMPDIKNDMQLFKSYNDVAIAKMDSYSIMNTPFKDVCLTGIHTAVFHPPLA